jgi:hypothetical protein
MPAQLLTDDLLEYNEGKVNEIARSLMEEPPII